MRFIKVSDTPLDSIPALAGKYKLHERWDDGVEVYTADIDEDTFASLEKLGVIARVVASSGSGRIEAPEDVLPLTLSVKMISSSPIVLRVNIAGHTVTFTAEQLLTPKHLEKALLEHRVFIRFSKKEWEKIVNGWLSMAEVVEEPGEDEEIAVLCQNFFLSSTLHDRLEASLYGNHIYYNKEDNTLWCRSESLIDHLKRKEIEISSRRLRAVLDEYIVGRAIQRRVGGQRYYFWVFDPEKLGVDVEKQMEDGGGVSHEED